MVLMYMVAPGDLPLQQRTIAASCLTAAGPSVVRAHTHTHTHAHTHAHTHTHHLQPLCSYNHLCYSLMLRSTGWSFR